SPGQRGRMPRAGALAWRGGGRLATNVGQALLDVLGIVGRLPETARPDIHRRLLLDGRVDVGELLDREVVQRRARGAVVGEVAARREEGDVVAQPDALGR